jgi:eukaryotic-like serine/threonine-protein kinase
VATGRHDTSEGSTSGIPRAPGAIVGDRYRIVRVIARGGTGVVYEAEHTWTGRRVAVKMLLPRHAGGEEQTRRFRQEAKSAARLVHPNIVEIIDMGCDGADEALFLVQGLLVGEDLEQRLERSVRLRPDDLVRVILPILDALRVAHQHGVLHRDIKPSNIFLVAGGGREVVPKLIDFGASKQLADGADGDDLTQSGALVGTPVYMSPEQIRGEVLDARSDLWSIGVVMYRALTGRYPFDTKSFAVLFSQILNSQVPRIALPEVPRRLAAVVHRALTPAREGRFAGVEAMIEAIEAPPSSPRPNRWDARERLATRASPPASDEQTVVDTALAEQVLREMRERSLHASPISDELTNFPAENERLEDSSVDDHAAMRVVSEPTPTPAPYTVRKPLALAAPARHAGLPPWRGYVRMGLVAAPRVVDGELLRRLEQALGGRWSLRRFASYSTLVDALCEDEIELAWLPPVAYLRARQLGPVHLLLALARGGTTAYGSALVASPRGGIQSLAQIRGKRVAWVDVWSAAGYLMPLGVLREAGLDPAQVFASQAFVGSHRAVLDALEQGRADLGATYCSLDEHGALVAAPWSDRPGFRPIALSGAIPGDAICASGELSLKDAEAMVEPLITLSTQPAGAALLRRLFGTERFAGVDPSYYQALEGV